MMLMKGGGGGGIEHEFHQLAFRFDKASQATVESRGIILRATGVQCLSWGFRDFRMKARKGTDAAGQSWKDITRSAFVSRLAKRSPYQQLLSQRHELTAKEKALTKDIAKGMPKGKSAGKAKIRAGIAWRFYEANPELRKIQKQRANVRKKQQALIDKEASQYEIGVDTGRLVNSLTFGIKELATQQVKGKPGDKQPPPAILNIEPNAVTVGSALEYAAYFDAKRPIFGPNFITPDRQKQLEARAVRLFEKLVGQQFDEPGIQPGDIVPD